MPLPSPMQLKLARTALGLTLKEACALAGISESATIDAEMGTRNSRGDVLGKLVSLYEQKGIQFITRTGIIFPPAYEIPKPTIRGGKGKLHTPAVS